MTSPPRPSEGTWTQHYPELGTAPIGPKARNLNRPNQYPGSGTMNQLKYLSSQGRLVGMLSDRDLRDRLGNRPSEWYHAAVASLADTVGDAMSREPIALIAGTWLEAALEIFADEGVGAIPIVDEDERVVGILSYVDVLSWFGRAGARAEAGDEFAPTTH